MKTVIPNALNKRTKFVGSPVTISTRNFFEFCPDFYKRLIPDAEIDVNLNGFCRTLPLPVPTLGRLNVVYRAFFVPYTSCFVGFNDFIANTIHVQANNQTNLIPLSRRFAEEHFTNLLISQSDQTNQSDFDFSIKVSASQTDYFKIKSQKGKRMLKIFHALGYVLTGVATSSSVNHMYDAMPLLALARIFCDYYYPSQFKDDSIYLYVKQILDRDNGVYDLLLQDLDAIFTLLDVTCYKDSVFVDGFVNPATPNTPFNDVVVQDITLPSTTMPNFVTVTSNNDNAPNIGNSVSASGALSQFALNWVQRLTQYFKRNQFAGGLAFDRLLARFGLKIYNDCSKYIGSYSLPISVGDVMSTTDNFDAQTDTGASLGSYAGKAIGADYNNGSGHFKFKAPTYGIFIIVASVIPQTDYFQGVDRENLCVTPLQYYTPEFDGLSPQMMSVSEVYNPIDQANNDPLDASNGFCFLPSYYEKKIFLSHVIGDYRLNSSNAGLDAYHMFREFSDSQFPRYDTITFGVPFIRAMDWEQYNRIFGLAGGKTLSPDAFRLRTEYNVIMYANMRSLYDDIDFDQLQHNGTGKSEVDVSSAKLN